MNPLYYTLCGEGSSDGMLRPVIEWALRQHLGGTVAINGRLSSRGGPLEQRIAAAVRQAGECDLLVIHLDADRPDAFADRVRQIDAATVASGGLPPYVRLVPVREAEAWLLFDQAAIRRAAGCPRGTAELGLPTKAFDQVADPKRVLNAALDRASELKGRKLSNFQRDRRPEWVAQWIDDFSPLRRLEAFQEFEAEVHRFATTWLAEQSEDTGP